jgi:hypothetical protein
LQRLALLLAELHGGRQKLHTLQGIGYAMVSRETNTAVSRQCAVCHSPFDESVLASSCLILREALYSLVHGLSALARYGALIDLMCREVTGLTYTSVFPLPVSIWYHQLISPMSIFHKTK